MKGNCGECERRWFCDINPDECDAWPDPIPQTNADHIRSMTDEELAGFVFGISGMTYDNAESWLKQPYKEDNDGR